MVYASVCNYSSTLIFFKKLLFNLKFTCLTQIALTDQLTLISHLLRRQLKSCEIYSEEISVKVAVFHTNIHFHLGQVSSEIKHLQLCKIILVTISISKK